MKPQAFSTLALVIHELMTNSAKYGALCRAQGTIEIAWAINASGQLTLDWREMGGPPVQAPTRRGFGSTIIERAIPFELKGQAQVEYPLSGLQAHFVIPSEFFVLAKAPPPAPLISDEKKPQARLHGKVLLVEDSMIIALNAEEMLLKLGASHVDTASDSQEALRLLDLYTPSFAMLDVHLGAETSFLIADRLQALGVPYIFATGYGDNTAFPSSHSAVPIVKKPYTAESIAAAAPLARSGG
ncbi:MAG: response regulator [Polaromonas sp.]